MNLSEEIRVKIVTDDDELIQKGYEYPGVELYNDIIVIWVSTAELSFSKIQDAITHIEKVNERCKTIPADGGYACKYAEMTADTRLKVRRHIQKSGNNFFEMLGDADDDLQDMAGEFMSMNEEYVLNHQGVNETYRTRDILKRGYSKNQLRLLSRMRETMLKERGICCDDTKVVMCYTSHEFLVAVNTVPEGTLLIWDDKQFNKGDNSKTPEAYQILRMLPTSDFILESKEDPDEKMECDCGNDTFRLYFEHVIDDANVYCTKCGQLL